MNLHMTLFFITPGKFSVAGITTKRFFAGMSSLVSCQVVASTEGPLTELCCAYYRFVWNERVILVSLFVLE